MGEEISEELEAKARDEAIKQMLKAWEERPEEKSGSWGTIFGHDAMSINTDSRSVIVALATKSTMAVTAHATGDSNYDHIVHLLPSRTFSFFTNSSAKIRLVSITGLGLPQQYAFGYLK